MSPRKQGWGSTDGKGTGVLLSGPEDYSHSPIVFAAPDRPEVTVASKPFNLSGIVATAGASTLVYVTKVYLAVVLVGLEGKITCMISFMAQAVKRGERFPLQDPLSGG